ncbi:hypothetical protein RIF29_21326 [Crotalaria pallida]|uniref:Uncharacterized protein n=1 Tax=Crotalaria pallida TaxID=3830 RepID=A0AAN9F4I8_CROPI
MDEGDANHVEEEAPVTVDATTQADNVTYIRGKGDIRVVEFTKVCDADDVKKFRFADNELAYAFYNTYGLVIWMKVEGWLEKPPLTVYRVCKYCNQDNRWEETLLLESKQLQSKDDDGRATDVLVTQTSALQDPAVVRNKGCCASSSTHGGKRKREKHYEICRLPGHTQKGCSLANEVKKFKRRHGVCSESSEELEDGDDVGNSLMSGQVIISHSPGWTSTSPSPTMAPSTSEHFLTQSVDSVL